MVVLVPKQLPTWVLVVVSVTVEETMLLVPVPEGKLMVI